ncbi:hypothetical protein V2G26_004464 [Clonostachys chloroleuca]
MIVSFASGWGMTRVQTLEGKTHAVWERIEVIGGLEDRDEPRGLRATAFPTAKEHRLYRRSLPSEPSNWKQVMATQFGLQWLRPDRKEWHEIQRQGVAKPAITSSATGQVLPLC